MARGRSRILNAGIVAVTALSLWYAWNYCHQARRNDLEDLAETEHNNQQPSKHIVFAANEQEDTSWVHGRFPEWNSSVYTQNDDSATLTVPVNKGGVAMVYLSFIIDNYYSLPDVMLFIHKNSDFDLNSNTVVSRLDMSYVKSQGYANIRCPWTDGCPTGKRLASPIDDRYFQENFSEAFSYLFPGSTMPSAVGCAGGSQFVLTRAKALEHPLQRYKKIRHYLIETWLDDNMVHRIMENSWHILFGKPAINCPKAENCYCQLFGICGLSGCSAGACNDLSAEIGPS